jgi:hypothetical protein
MNTDNLNEDLNNFKKLINYKPEEGLIKEAKSRRTYLTEEDPEEETEEGGEQPAAEEGGDFDFGEEGSPEEGEEGLDMGNEEMPNAEEEPEEDEFGTAGQFSAADDLEGGDEEVEEIDVTAIVKGSDEAKEMAQQAVSVGEKNTEFLQSLTDKLSNLESSLTKMDTIASKINKLEQDVKTPEEKLELRSLDSYPFNVNLSDYWEDKATKDKNYRISSGVDVSNGEEKEYVINPEEVDDYNESDIEDSFSSSSSK